MEFEVGKRFKTRDGRIVRIIEIRDADVYPIKGIMERDGGLIFSWKRDGSFYGTCNKSIDLVERVETALKIEAGKFYRSYGGGKVHIAGRSENDKYWVAEALNGQESDDCRLYRVGDDGKNLASNEYWDLVGEWKDDLPGFVLNVYGPEASHPMLTSVFHEGKEYKVSVEAKSSQGNADASARAFRRQFKRVGIAKVFLSGEGSK